MYKPERDRVLVKVIEKKKAEAASTIIIPDTCEVKAETCRFAEIVAFGERTPMIMGAVDAPLSVGKRIVINTYGGTEVVLDGVKYLVIKYEEILLREAD